MPKKEREVLSVGKGSKEDDGKTWKQHKKPPGKGKPVRKATNQEYYNRNKNQVEKGNFVSSYLELLCYSEVFAIFFNFI